MATAVNLVISYDLMAGHHSDQVTALVDSGHSTHLGRGGEVATRDQSCEQWCHRFNSVGSSAVTTGLANVKLCSLTWHCLHSESE